MQVISVWEVFGTHHPPPASVVEEVGLWLLREHRTVSRSTLARAVDATIAWAPQRTGAVLGAVDVAVRAADPEDGPMLAPWLPQALLRLRTALGALRDRQAAVACACAVECAVVHWVTLGHLDGDSLGIRVLGEDVAAPSLGCPKCTAGFGHGATHAAHVLAHLRSEASLARLRARRPSKMRAGAVRRAVAAARWPAAAPAWAEPRSPVWAREGDARSCATCGDGLCMAFCDACGEWEWVHAGRSPGGRVHHGECLPPEICPCPFTQTCPGKA